MKAVRVALALGLGLGLASVAQFFSLLLLGPGALGAAVSLVAGLAAGAAIARAPGEPTVSGERIRRGLAIAFAVVAATAIVDFVLCTWNAPLGRWDAWMIWNLRARFIARPGDAWREAFSDRLPWSHPDYPLALPLSVAGLWRLCGSETVLVPAALGFVYTFATTGVLVGVVRAVRGANLAMLAGIALLGTDTFVRHGASQYADVPLGFHVLVALGALALADAGAGRGWLAVAGAAAGLAAWTKNEGVVFLGALAVARAAGGLRDGRALAREAGLFAAGAAPALVALATFKLALAPPNDLLAAQGAPTAARLADASRWAAILGALARDLARLPLFLALVPAVALLGAREGAWRDRTVRVVAATLGLVALGWFAAYLTTPFPLDWHLKTSLPRLILQTWPSAILLAFLVARSPVEADA